MECNARSTRIRRRRRIPLLRHNQQSLLNNGIAARLGDDDVLIDRSRPMSTVSFYSLLLRRFSQSCLILCVFMLLIQNSVAFKEDDLSLSFADVATNISRRSPSSKRLKERSLLVGIVPAIIAQTFERHNIMPADVPLIQYDINFAGDAAARFNFPSEHDIAPAFEKRERPAAFFSPNSPASSNRSQPSRRALAPQLLNQLDSALVDNIARRILPQVQTELHIEENRAIASIDEPEQRNSDVHALNARAAALEAAANRNLTERQSSPRRFSSSLDQNDLVDDDDKFFPPNDNNDGPQSRAKTTRDMTRVFAKPTMKSVQLMRLATAMEEMTRAMKQQLQLTNEDVAVVLPQVDLRNTTLGPMVTMGDIPRGKINFDGLPSNVQNFGVNDLANARQFVRNLNRGKCRALRS